MLKQSHPVNAVIAAAAREQLLTKRPDGTLFYARKRPRGTPKVAVAILCRDQGRFLAEAIESVLDQTWPAREVVVIDDASTDDTAAVAARFAARDVRYQRINARHPRGAKRAALDATTSEAIMFLDADDVLPPTYLSDGAPLLIEHTTGIVYSDIQEFGESDELRRFPDFDPGLLIKRNFIHNGALVLRQALLISQALDPPDGVPTHDDWRVWRKVVAAGFRAVKQSSLYRYRRHPDQLSRKSLAVPYYDKAGLCHETITVFIPLSGREAAWDSHLRPWLDGQTWPRERVRLVLADTSQDPAFGRKIREWLHRSDYAEHDARYYRQTVGAPGLNAKPRPNDGGVEVNLALRRIYLRMARELTTDHVVVIEDDHRPPPDAIERLLRGLDDETVAVSGLYRGRSAAGEYVVWSHFDPASIRPEPGAAIRVSGSGFGTLLLRRSAFSQVVSSDLFTARSREPYPYDIGFAARCMNRGDKWKLARDVLSEHHGAPALPPLPGAPKPDAATGPEAAALAIVRRCPHARLCACADRGKIDCGPNGKRPGETLPPAECEACLGPETATVEPAAPPTVPAEPRRVGTAVSVIVAARNNGAFLRDALASALHQTAPAIEVLYADDGSTDDSLTIAAEFPDVRVFPASHAGVCAARNRAVAQARGDWLLHLDGDDVLPHRYLEQRLTVAQRESDAAFVYGAAQAFGGEWNYFWDTPEWDIPERLWNGNFVNTSTLYRRDAFEAVGRWDHGIGTAWDWDLSLRMMQGGFRGVRDREAFLLYRHHAASVSHRSGLKTHDVTPATDRMRLLVRSRRCRVRIVSLVSGRLPGLLPAWLEAVRRNVRYRAERLAAEAPFDRFGACQAPLPVLELVHTSAPDARRRIKRGADFSAVHQHHEPWENRYATEQERRDNLARFLAGAYNRHTGTEELVWFLEDDVIPPDHALDALARAVLGAPRPLHAATGAYRSRHDGPDRYVAHHWDGRDPATIRSVQELPATPEPVDMAGTGCLLVFRPFASHAFESHYQDIPAHDWRWCLDLRRLHGDHHPTEPRVLLLPDVQCRHYRTETEWV